MSHQALTHLHAIAAQLRSNMGMPLVEWLDHLCYLIKNDNDPAEVVWSAYELVNASFARAVQANGCLSRADGEGPI